MEYWQILAKELRCIINDLDYDFSHFSIDEFVDWLQAKKRRRIDLVSWVLPPSISGAWLSTVSTEYIFYDENAPRIQKEHIQLNHLGRLLLNHRTLMVDGNSTFDNGDLQQVAFRGVFDQMSKKVLMDMINYILISQQKEISR